MEERRNRLESEKQVMQQLESKIKDTDGFFYREQNETFPDLIDKFKEVMRITGLRHKDLREVKLSLKRMIDKFKAMAGDEWR